MEPTNGGDIPFRLTDYTAVESVKNIVLFISDSLRYDFFPESVAELGVSTQVIAPSTFTASSVPSLLMGKYPSEHKVWNFSHKLPETPYLLRTAESSGVDVSNVWGTDYENDEKPTLSLLDLDEHTPLDELEPPFTAMVHDHGGHSPYGEPGDDFKPSKEFFEEHVDDTYEIVEKYKQGIAKSAERFHEIYESFQDRGITDETLFVFTSDHGELLGEYGGLYEHTSPMVPELLEVPVVFCGAGISTDIESDSRISGIDIAPTLLGAQNRQIPSEMTGYDLWNGEGSDRMIRADAWRDSRYGDYIYYKASSAWDDSGGVIVQKGPKLGRAVFGLYVNLVKAPHSPITRKSMLNSSLSISYIYMQDLVEYENIRRDKYETYLKSIEFEHPRHQEVDVDEEKLKALGYIE